MCGIAGYFNFQNDKGISSQILQNMIASLTHRGPDEFGMYRNGKVGLVQSRLSIIDLSGGSQPIHNEDKSVWIVFNGEIFNYIELREELYAKGHLFYTQSDTEVIVHLYEEYGENFVDHLNGQFAIAMFDKNLNKLIMARDHAGIIPLFYANTPDNTVIFASEMKALMQHPRVNPEIDLDALFQLYTFWVNLPGQTPFKNISELPPGHMLTVDKDGLKIRKYWDLHFPVNGDCDWRSQKQISAELEELLNDASAIRLRADVPVASYLSGGIDSSVVASLIKKFHQNDLTTFSVAFDDEAYDESKYQKMMHDYLQTDHYTALADNNSIADVISDVVYFGERPSIRTAPAPLFILSRLVRERGIKVVLTGEGADEAFAGYNIFKEAKVRQFIAQNPDSPMREQLLFHLYPYVNGSDRAGKFWLAFFKKGLKESASPLFSHLVRWNNSSSIVSFMNKELQQQYNYEDLLNRAASILPEDFSKWHPVSRAQYIETKMFLPGYLLSTQGDRMLMANSVEGRFPYLDKRVMEFAAKIPPSIKMNGLNEKYILKETFKNILPDQIINRPKQPYRAPIYKSLLDKNAPEKIKERIY
jgi:asparagine synthase (glutamine-hydrolysing)